MAEMLSASGPSPEILQAMIDGEKAVIEQIMAADPVYYAYVRRHRAERRGEPMGITEFYRIRRELESLYRSTTEALRRRDPDAYAENCRLIFHYEHELVA
jgi:hypothetical protein